jgi:hypothetical protein
MYQAPAAVYNLTVSNAHTYYVAVGDMPVLVHNCGSNWVPDENYSEEAIAERSAQWQQHVDDANGKAAQRAVRRGQGPGASRDWADRWARGKCYW